MVASPRHLVLLHPQFDLRVALNWEERDLADDQPFSQRSLEVESLTDIGRDENEVLPRALEENVEGRKESAEQAEEIIVEAVGKYARERGARNGQDLIELFRNSANNVRDAELKKAIERLDLGSDPGEVLSRLAHDLTNKLIHSPTLTIRNAASDDRKEILDYIRKSLEHD